jgi:hypothetical protein
MAKETHLPADGFFEESIFQELHVSLTIGFENPGRITIAGKTPATIHALNDAAADASTDALGTDDGKVRTGGGPVQNDSKAGESGGNQSVTVKMLLKRMAELQKQLQEQQQQLAAAQAASYPTPEAKETAVMAVQGQIAETSGALAEVAGALVKEMSKGTGSGGLVNTTA